MQKRTRIILICILCAVALLIGTYCLLRFQLKISLFDQSGWTVREGQTVYLDYDGNPITGWQTLEQKTYYFDPETGYLYTGWMDTPDGTCFLTKDGLHTGWLEYLGEVFYLNESGIRQTGWVTVDGAQYFLDEFGAIGEGWIEYEGKRYYLEQGVPYTGWLEQSDGNYYLTDAGVPFVGWMDSADGKYYFSPDGIMQTGWQEIDGQRFYFLTDGIMQTGWQDIGGKRFFLKEDGVMHTGWLENGADRYYFLQDGAMAVGQVEIDGKATFFTSAGKYVLLVNRWNFMPDDYTPNLVEFNGFQVDASCRDALEQMILDCKAAGYNCYINNTYRSKATQQNMWDVRIKQRMAEGMSREEAIAYIGQSLALVGASEHHLGLAVDLNGSDKVYDWLAEHCWDYGFILRYPDNKMDVTGIIYEPWHFRYVGTELSKELQASGLCMEEYMQQLTAGAAQ
jgi:glucan-binding YG repeat protein